MKKAFSSLTWREYAILGMINLVTNLGICAMVYYFLFQEPLLP